MSSDLIISQQLLEQNEDILAAIGKNRTVSMFIIATTAKVTTNYLHSVENLQLGRLSDCMQHYAILQANLVSLATELDNFPAGENNPYSALDGFPDEIMRKDILEDLKPAGSRVLPKPPVIPPCAACLARKVSLLFLYSCIIFPIYLNLYTACRSHRRAAEAS